MGDATFADNSLKLMCDENVCKDVGINTYIWIGLCLWECFVSKKKVRSSHPCCRMWFYSLSQLHFKEIYLFCLPKSFFRNSQTWTLKCNWFPKRLKVVWKVCNLIKCAYALQTDLEQGSDMEVESGRRLSVKNVTSDQWNSSLFFQLLLLFFGASCFILECSVTAGPQDR